MYDVVLVLCLLTSSSSALLRRSSAFQHYDGRYNDGKWRQRLGGPNCIVPRSWNYDDLAKSMPHQRYRSETERERILSPLYVRGGGAAAAHEPIDRNIKQQQQQQQQREPEEEKELQQLKDNLSSGKTAVLNSCAGGALAKSPILKSAAGLASASAFSVLGGVFYLWSMLLPSLQTTLGCSRAKLSTVFSLSTICFTAGTSLGPPLYTRLHLPVAGVVLLCASISALGLLLAAVSSASSLGLVALGYAGIFGMSSGIMYSLNMKISNAGNLFKGWQGVATGIIVSFRALGAPLFSPIVRRALDGGGEARAALKTMALAVIGLGLGVAASMLPFSWDDLGGLKRKSPSEGGKDGTAGDDASTSSLSEHRSHLALLWTCLLCGSFPGILAHGHAGAMSVARGGMSPAGISALATGSLWGRLCAGAIVDLLGPKRCLVITPLFCAAAILVGALLDGTLPLHGALCGMGLCYGMNAVVISVATAKIVGSSLFSKAYGLVFTAWGTAGILAPVVAGVLYDRTGGYNAAMVVATVATAFAAVAAMFLPSTQRQRGSELTA